MNVTVLILLAVFALVATWLIWSRSGRQTPRQRALLELLDAADALEDLLRTARSEIKAVSGSQEADPVADALREMLRQRLWLRDYGRDASLEQLSQVRRTIDAARDRVDQQLQHIRQARTS